MQTTSQSLLAERGRFAASVAPALIRTEIDTENYARLFLSGFEAALRQGRRDAQRLYCELLEMVGAQERTLEVALRVLGVSLEVAQVAVGHWQEAKAVPKPMLVESCRKMLETEGWRCLPPEGEVNGNGGGTDAGSQP